MKLYLQCAEQQRCFYKITDCCACHGKWLPWLIRITYETLVTMRGAKEMSLQHHQILRLPRKVTLIIDPLFTHETLFTMRGVTSVIVQSHQILRLPRKVTLIIDPLHTWNVIYNARSKRDVSPTSPNTAPATKSNTHHWSSSHMKRYLQCAE